MNTTLWIIQAFLATVFLITGSLKLTQPRLKLADAFMGWAHDVGDAQFRAIGALEVLGALGLILPGNLGIATALTPLAAAGLALTMAGAVATHVRMDEKDKIGPPLILLTLSLFVAIERFGAYAL